jgi:hypothetical protein
MTLPPILLQPGQSVTVGAAGGAVKPLLDPGWPATIKTGHITAVPTSGSKFGGDGTFSMFSPPTPNEYGECSANLVLSPDGGGLRLIYPTTLKAGGWSPVRFGIGIPNPANIGTGKYYQQMLARFMAGYVFPAGTGIKLCEPRTMALAPTPGPPPTENHVIGTRVIGTSTTDAAYYTLLQGPGSQARNLPPNVAGQDGSCTGGAQVLLESLFLPESTPGAGDGMCRTAVGGVLVSEYTNVQWLAFGNQPGWGYLMFDPTYGGAGGSPPVNQWWEFDQLVVETA